MNDFCLGVWVGRLIPVPSIFPEILDSLRNAKAVAKVFHLGCDSGKLTESRQLEEKFPVFSPPEFFTVHKNENFSKV